MITNIKDALKYLDILQIDPYEFFGRSPLSIIFLTEEQKRCVIRQHRTLAREYHPDRTGDHTPEGNLKIQQINEAREELLDGVKKLTWIPKQQKVQDSIKTKELKRNCASIIKNISLSTIDADFLIFKKYLSELELELDPENTLSFLRETFHVLQNHALLEKFIDLLLADADIERFSFLLIIPNKHQINRLLPKYSNDQRIDLIKKMMPEMALYYYNSSLNQLLEYIYRIRLSVNINHSSFFLSNELDQINKTVKISKLYRKEQYEEALKLILNVSCLEEKDLIKLVHANEENPNHLRIIFNYLNEAQRARLMSGLLTFEKELSLNMLYAIAPYPEHLEKGLARASQGVPFDLIQLIYPELYLFQSRTPIKGIERLFPGEDVTSDFSTSINSIFSSIHMNERYNSINYFESYDILIKSLNENECKNFIREDLARPFLRLIITPEGIKMPLLIKIYLNIYREKLKRIDELNMLCNIIWDGKKYHHILGEVERYHQNGRMMQNEMTISDEFIKKVADVTDFLKCLQGFIELKAEPLLANRISLLTGGKKWEKSLLVLLINHQCLLKTIQIIPFNQLFDLIRNMDGLSKFYLNAHQVLELKELARLKLDHVKEQFIQIDEQAIELHRKIDGELAETLFASKINTLYRTINKSMTLVAIFKEIHELDVTFQAFENSFDTLKALPINKRRDFVANKSINNNNLLSMAIKFPDILCLIFNLLPEESKFDLISEHLTDLSEHQLIINLLKHIFYGKIKQVSHLNTEKYLVELHSKMDMAKDLPAIRQLYYAFQDRGDILQLKAADILIELDKINEKTPHWAQDQMFVRTLLSQLEYKDTITAIQLALKAYHGNLPIINFFKENADDMIPLITSAPNQFQFICDFRILCQNNQLVPLIKTILLNQINEMSSSLVRQKEKMCTDSPQFFKVPKVSPEDTWKTFKTKIDTLSKASDLGFIAMQMNKFIQKHQKAEISLNLNI